MNGSAGQLGFAFKAADEVEDGPGFGPPVHDVSHLNEMRPAARPAEVAVDEPRGLQDFDEGIVGAVEVADGDDFSDVLEDAGPAALGKRDLGERPRFKGRGRNDLGTDPGGGFGPEGAKA